MRPHRRGFKFKGMSILITGAAGFIGSNFVLNWLEKNKEKVVVLDKLTYAGNLENLKSVEKNQIMNLLKVILVIQIWLQIF